MKKKMRFHWISWLIILCMIFQALLPFSGGNKAAAQDLEYAIANENPGQETVTFKVRFTNGGTNPSYSYVVGQFNNWTYDQKYRLNWMEDPSEAGVWKMMATISIPAGTYEYKFRTHYGDTEPNNDDKWITPTSGTIQNDNGVITVSPKDTGVKLQSSRPTVSSTDPTYFAADFYGNDGEIEELQPTYTIEPAVTGASIDAQGCLRVTAEVADQQEVTVVAETTKGRVTKTVKVTTNDPLGGQNRIHYTRYDGAYDDWNVWSIPTAGDGTQVDFSETNDFGRVAGLGVNADAIIRKGNWQGRETRATLTADQQTNGVRDLYVVEGDSHFYTDFRAAVNAAKPKVIVAIMDSEREIKAYLTHVPTATTTFELYVDGVKKEARIALSEKTLTVTLPEGEQIDTSSLLEIKANKMFQSAPVMMRRVLDSKTYDGDDLGAVYAQDTITLKLWAPTANAVSAMIYDSADQEKAAGTEVKMEIDETTGVWSVSLPRAQYEGKYYLYQLNFYDQVANSPYQKTTFAVDPYATAVGLNGDKAALIDPQDPSTMPEGWQNSTKPPFGQPEDAIIYEMHVRDFTIHEDSGVTPANRGKFLGVVEAGTTVRGEGKVKTGLDHLKELGVTHVHLIPVYDFATVNEAVTDDPTNRNWGYDPKNYNAIEGSYATDAADPKVRIKEYRQMVKGLHDNGIRVVMDVVYNHMYNTDNMDSIVPGYYFRSDDRGRLTDGSACGNEVASDRPMIRKFIIDSCKQWAKNYAIDGLRFDLMSLIDVQTMQQVTQAMKAIDSTNIIYGEPWAGGVSGLPQDQQTLDGRQKNQHFGVFNDTFRDALRGNNDPGKGYINYAPDGTRDRIKEGLKGSVDSFTADPEETINYVDVHDNYNLWDQIALTSGKQKPLEELATITADQAMTNPLVQRALLGQGLVLTAQGVPLTQAGTEFLRSKQGDGNSYKSPDDINAIRWSQKETYAAVNDYVEGLMKLRKEHPAFRLQDAASVQSQVGVWNAKHQENIILMHLKDHAGGDRWKNIFVIYNPTDNDYAFNEGEGTGLPEPEGGSWQVVVDETKAGTETLRTVGKYGIVVKPRSMMVMYDQEKEVKKLSWSHLFADQSSLYMEPMAPKSTEDVTVRFRAKAGEVETATLHYYDEADQAAGDRSMPMTKVEDEQFYQKHGFDPAKVEFWQAVIPQGSSVKYYNFEVHSRDDAAWISGGVHEGGSHNGVTATKPTFGSGIAYGFRIVPDYQLNTKLTESIFYQIMVDRFRNGDTANDRSVLDPAVGNDPMKRDQAPEILQTTDVPRAGTETDQIWNNDFYNGDLTGVQEALPYLTGLGVNGLYLMPIMQSSSNHKYDTEDYEHVDTNFGGNKALAELTAAAHQNGAQIVLDGVFNHTGSLHPWFIDAKADEQSEYRKNYFFGSGSHDVEGGYYAWNRIPGLPKLNYAEPAVETYMYKGDNAIVKKYLRPPYSIDGWRMDAADDIAKGAHEYTTEGTVEEHKAQNLSIWADMRQAILAAKPDAYVLGEFWKEDGQWFDGAHWDGKMNYSGFLLPFVQNRQQNEFLGKQSLDNNGDMSVADIAAYGRTQFSKFPYQAMLQSTNSLSTHDRPRFLDWNYTGANNEQMMELAAALQMTYVGVPMIYYGDEVGMYSAKTRSDKKSIDEGNDPYNRAAFNWDATTWNHEMLHDYQKLIAARKAHQDAFVYGAFEEVISHRDDKYLVYARYGGNDRALVVLNNSGAGGSKQLQIRDVSRYGFSEGDVLHDALTGETVTVEQDQLTLTSRDMSAAVYLLQPVAVTEITTAAVGEVDDGRTELPVVEDVISETAEDGSIRLSWKQYESEQAQSLLVRAYNADYHVVHEQMVDKSKTAYQLPQSTEISCIAIKAVADRSQAVDGIDDTVRDSDYAFAYVKSVSPQAGAEAAETDTKIEIDLDPIWKLTKDDLQAVKLLVGETDQPNQSDEEKEAVEVEVTVEANRLTVTPKQPLEFKKHYTVILPTLTADRIKQLPASNAVLSGYRYQFTTEDKTLKQVTVHFDSNGGSGEMADVTVAENTEWTLPENGFAAPEGKKFDGWLVGEEKKQPGDHWIVTEDITIQAVWQAVETPQPDPQPDPNPQPNPQPKIGWQRLEDGRWIYVLADGSRLKSAWKGDYYLMADGIMADDKWIYDKQHAAHYYLKKGGLCAYSMWKDEYYLKADGKMAANQWIYDKQYQAWYYLKADGRYARNEWKGEFYLKAGGNMAVNCWIYDQQYQAWYYLKADGRYARNEWKGEFYLKAGGNMAVNCWIYDKQYQAWYYLQADGRYARNTVISGKYKVGADGKLIE